MSGGDDPDAAKPVPAAPRALSRYIPIYILALITLLTAVVLATLPAFFDWARFLYDNQPYVQTLFILLSVSVALVTFGVIGDSTGSVTSSWFQLGGSAAGALLFYWTLSNALNPYETKLLVIKPADAPQPPPQEFDLRVDIKELTQQVSTNQRQARVLIPKSAELFGVRIPGTDGRNWRIESVTPDECYSNGYLKTSCESSFGDIQINVIGEQCVSSLNMSVGFRGQTTLRSMIGEFVKAAQGPVLRLPLQAHYETSVGDSEILPAGFEHSELNVNGYPDGQIDFCFHLAAIEGVYNEQNRQRIELYADCRNVYAVPAAAYPKRSAQDICANR
ncbi:hypothetical protein [Mesorhizobium mediterraneum]|uniref:hypothetical protein n=1 Tax=Mesorhizobium mediterraneum TaxID=43617 RepID=UPI0017826223|nr:hypothetical protein [Mesorhizobium mediterraneum]